MNLLFLAVFIIWIVTEVVLSSIKREKHRPETGGGHRADRNTLRIIWTVTVSANTIAAIVAVLTNVPIVSAPGFRYVGIAIMVLGLALRIASIVSLGRMFTYNVAIRDGHQLVTSGLYRFVRHPSYSGLLIIFIGYGLGLNNWLSLVIAFMPVFWAIMRRTAVEESVLEDQFGDVYREYKKRIARFVPWIF
ncbi:methyltransferase family protein [Burkholderia stabilis]|uniref:methyltransferase family protein n=1 Tax=Burkholderia stabilis TaxID=95485 RepID=UPI00158EB80E|nr:isoprenylcysteine carboxylmethyltransferase family protein [Burkholderia stabilis]